MIRWNQWDRDPRNTPPIKWVACPLCKGTGKGLGEFTHQNCPCCSGFGEIEEAELDYANTFGDPEEYWGVFYEEEDLIN